MTVQCALLYIGISLLTLSIVSSRIAIGTDDAASKRPGELVKKLESSDFETREAATAALKNLDAASIPALQAAAREAGPELQARVNFICKVIELRGKLSPELRAATPGIEDDLAKDQRNWPRHFLNAVESARKTGRPDLEVLAMGAFVASRADKQKDELKKVMSDAADLKIRALIPEFIKLLDDEDWTMQDEAAQILGRMEAREAAPKLTKLIEEDRGWLSAHSADALGRLGSKEAVPNLIKLLDAEFSVSRASAARALGHIGGPDALGASRKLIQLLSDEDSETRYHAASALGELRVKEAVPDLIKCLSDKDGHVGSFAARALGELKAREAIPEIVKHLDKKSWYGSFGFATALCEMEHEAGVDYIVEQFPNICEIYRGSAVVALAKSKSRHAAPLLVKILNDGDGYACAYAAFGLGLLGQKDSASRLEELAKGEDKFTNLAAQFALTKLGVKDFREQILKGLQEENEWSLCMALQSAGELGLKSAAPELRKLLERPNHHVRKTAREALEKIEKP